MKKVFYALCTVSAIASLTLSCVKESSPIEENTDNKTSVADVIPTEILCVINPDDAQTKTQYESNTTFGWTYQDQVRMPVAKWSGANGTGSITACDFFTFTTVVASGSASASFTIYNGSDDMEGYDPNPSGAAAEWTSMGYLVYPASLVNYKAYYGSKPGLTLPSSITYNASNPLDGGVIPLIGRKDGATYKFSTAVGIIKLTLSNAPSAAKKIKLVSAANDLAGDFVPTDVDETVSQLQLPSSGYGEKTITLTGLSLTNGESYDFFFPVPVGTYAANDLSVTLLDSNDLPLLEKTIAKSLTVARNEVLSIPTLLYHRIYVDSVNPYHPTLHIENFPTGASRVLVHVSNSKLTSSNYSTQWANSKNGNRFNGNINAWDLTTLSPSSGSFFSESGTYFLQYIIINSGDQKPSEGLNDNKVMIYGSVPFVYTARTKMDITSSMVSTPYYSDINAPTSTADKLVDGKYTGNNATWWHSPYDKDTTPYGHATYGQIISIDLNPSTTNGDFDFSFCTRSANANHAKVLNVYVSNVPWNDASFDTNKVKVGDSDNALAGITATSGHWTAPLSCTAEGENTYRYITISILTNSEGVDLRTYPCCHMAEIEFYTD